MQITTFLKVNAKLDICSCARGFRVF